MQTVAQSNSAINLETIRAGMENGEFYLEYLPTISLSDGRCLGAEALARWRRPSGIVPPGQFIPMSENTPLSGLITYWVIDTVTAEMSDWLRANPHAHISINVPPEILGRGGMEYAAKKSGLIDLADQLVFEITERGVPDAMGVEAINNLWDRKLRVALDDVTLTSGANLAVLARCNFNIIKLDQTLVQQIVPDNCSPEWLPGIRAFVENSKIQVIAEGIETELQYRTLHEAKIHAGQGWYFSRPIRATDFIAHQTTRGDSRIG